MRSTPARKRKAGRRAKGPGYKAALAKRVGSKLPRPFALEMRTEQIEQPERPTHADRMAALHAELEENRRLATIDAREPRWSLVPSDKMGLPDLAHPFLGPADASQVRSLAGTEDDWTVSAKVRGCAWSETRFFPGLVALPRSTSRDLQLSRGIASVTLTTGKERIVLLRCPDNLDSADQNSWLRRELRSGGGSRYVYIHRVSVGCPDGGPVTWKPARTPPLGSGQPVRKLIEVLFDGAGKVTASKVLE